MRRDRWGSWIVKYVTVLPNTSIARPVTAGSGVTVSVDRAQVCDTSSRGVRRAAFWQSDTGSE